MPLIFQRFKHAFDEKKKSVEKNSAQGGERKKEFK